METYQSFTPWYGSRNNEILSLAHTQCIPRTSKFLHGAPYGDRSKNALGDRYVTEDPQANINVTFAQNVKYCSNDELTETWGSGLNSIIFNRGGPFVTILYNNILMNVETVDNLTVVNTQPTYLVLETTGQRTSVITQNLVEGSTNWYTQCLTFYNDYEPDKNLPITIDYAAHKLRVRFPSYDLAMSPLNGQALSTIPSNVNIIWSYPTIGFTIDYSPDTQLLIEVDVEERLITATRKVDESHYWLLYYDLDEALDITDNTISTLNPTTGTIQLVRLENTTTAVDFLLPYLGSYWKSAALLIQLMDDTGNYSVTFDRKGTNQLWLVPGYWHDYSFINMTDLTESFWTPKYGSQKYYSINGDNITVTSSEIIFEDWPSLAGIIADDKDRLRDNIKHAAQFYTIAESLNLYGQSFSLFIGARLLALGSRLNISLDVEPLLNVRTLMADRLTTILAMATIEDVIADNNHGGIVYALTALQDLGYGFYGTHMAIIDTILIRLENHGPNIYQGLAFNSLFGYRLELLFSGYVLAKLVGQNSIATNLLGRVILMMTAFTTYGQLHENTNQGVGLLEDEAGPIHLTYNGKVLSSLIGTSVSSYPARYYSILLQQTSLPHYELMNLYFTDEWMNRLTPDIISQSETCALLERIDTNLDGSYRSINDTVHLGVIGMAALAKNANVEMEYFASTWSKLSKSLLNGPGHLLGPGYNRSSILYWLTTNGRFDSLGFTCYQFYLNPSSSCDKQPENPDEPGYNFSQEKHCHGLTFQIHLNGLHNDLASIDVYSPYCKSCCLTISGIRKVVKGDGSLYQKATNLGIDPKVLLIYSAAYLGLLALAKGSCCAKAEYLRRSKFFYGLDIINSTQYRKYSSFIGEIDLAQYFID